jgi:hypothetical protein
MHPPRTAALLLLVVWVGPVTLVQTDSWRLLELIGVPERATAESRVVPAGEALLLQPGTPLKLRLRDGSILEGRFLGRTLLDSAFYAPRFAAHVRSSSFVPFGLGETLRVSLRDGREWAAPFAGYGELTLLLRSPDGSQSLRLPFEFVREVQRSNGDRVEPRDLTLAFHRGLLPSAEAIALEALLPVGSEADRWASALRVAVEDIQSATATLGPGKDVPIIVVLSIFVAVTLLLVVIASHKDRSDQGCRSVTADGWNPLGFAGAHLTTRPFDRYRGCYVDDPLAVADTWPAATEGPAMALADTAMSDPLVR